MQEQANCAYQGPGTLIEVHSYQKENGNGPRNRARSGKTGKHARVWKIDGNNAKVAELTAVRGGTFTEMCQRLRPVLQEMNIPHSVQINRNGVTFIPPAD